MWKKQVIKNREEKFEGKKQIKSNNGKETELNVRLQI